MGTDNSLEELALSASNTRIIKLSMGVGGN